MEVDRGDKTDVTRATDVIRDNEGNDALPNETPEKAEESASSQTFSSERFIFSSFAEENIDCIDKAGSMFKELKKKKPPTFREALESMGYAEKTEKLFKIFTDRANERLEELEAPGLSVEDVATIFCYTHEGGVDSPYRKLNHSISVDRSNSALRKTRVFLFLLLQALRKLPRYTPENRTLYRGINIHVKTEVDSEHPETKPYAKGNEKTWWTFTSTSEDLEVTRYFVQNNKNKKGTLFTLSGEAWGYDISAFSNFPDEKEILLEPERRLSIKDVKKEGAIITVNAEILDTPLVLKEYIKVKPVKIKEKKSRFKDAPRNLRVESITESTVTLSWGIPEKNGDNVVSYQVSARQTSDRFINRNPESTYIVKKDETKYTVKDLEEGKEYEFRVRCKYKDGWGKEWSEKINARVKWKYSWKECPSDIDEKRKYSVDEKNSRIATKTIDYGYCTIIGDTPVPLDTVTSWSIKVLRSSSNDGCNIHIGVAQNDINQDADNNDKCGWYFYCYDSKLNSGPLHNYRDKEYGPRKGLGQYVHTGDSVGVVVDATKGDLSFVLNGVNLGVAYEGIPLDKSLVPCVLLGHQGDSVVLDISEVKENVDNSILVPSNITAKSITWDTIILTWDEVIDVSFYQIEVDGSVSCDTHTTNTFTKGGLLPETEHSFRVRTVRGSSVSEWSYAVEGRMPKESFETSCVWKKCPDDVYDDRKYSVDGGNPRIATKTSSDYKYSTIIGNAPILPNAVTSWNIKILKSKDNNGYGIYIGIAPNDIDQNNYNYGKCGWYFDCYYSVLSSGPPHNYRSKVYGPRKEWSGEYVHDGDSVGVVIDTTKGDLSFVLDNVNYGVAYSGVTLDKPLVPCVILEYKGDSVELDFSEVKENVDSSIPVPSNITAKSITWDSITLTWDEVVDASFYQVETDGSKSCDISTTNTFTKRGLLAEAEHSIRVRTVRGSSASEWSDVVEGRTLKKSFGNSAWKTCPDYVDDNKKCRVDEKNPRVATKISNVYDSCTTIGNTPIPPNKVTSWSIKVLKSRDDDGSGIWIGIVPFDINQNVDNRKQYRWYFNCYYSSLCSGPPHKYNDKKYGPRKDYGQYVHTGDSVGVVMDTTKGDLSFVLNGVNLGVAYCGIPFDKPLVPCVLLWCQGDSVELDFSEVKENEVGSSIPVPSNITTESITWDSITLTWDKVDNASFYQIEVDESKSWETSTTNTFTKRYLLPDTEHIFRVRTVRGSSVSEWSSVVEGRMPKESFERSAWKECPDYVGEDRKYNVDEGNPRVATKVNSDGYCTIIGSTYIPLNKVTSWNIKILKSKNNNGSYINIGIAPNDINQNDNNCNTCGWYFYCYNSSLYSGPPHNYDYPGKKYGPKKENGQYVHTGDSVGVVVDTTKGELSFVLNGVNLGVAYEGIPLDKPLVPCVLLKYERDSVELDTSEIKTNQMII